MSTLSLKIANLMSLNNIKNERDLANYIHVKYEDLCYFLANKSKNPNKKILNKIANFFEIPADELIQDDRIESVYIPEAERHHDTPSAVLRYLMQDIGNISEGELFRRTGVPQPTIHRILSGATPNPRLDSIQPLAEFFNVTPDQMLARVPLPKDRISGTFVALTETQKIVPLLSWSEIIYWPRILKNPEFKKDRNWVTAESGSKDALFALKIAGTDYLPDFRKGTIIIIDSKRKPKNGDFGLGIVKDIHEIVLGRISFENQYGYLNSIAENNLQWQIGQTVDLYGIVSEAKYHF